MQAVLAATVLACDAEVSWGFEHLATVVEQLEDIAHGTGRQPARVSEVQAERDARSSTEMRMNMGMARISPDLLGPADSTA